jgi:hypothetical protein
MVDPTPRIDSDTSTLNTEPCGTAEKSSTHYLSKPGSRNYVQWKVSKSSPDGNCTVRLGSGLDEDDFTVLKPTDGTADENGKFPCGRVGGYDGKEFKFSKGSTCESCTL